MLLKINFLSIEPHPGQVMGFTCPFSGSLYPLLIHPSVKAIDGEASSLAPHNDYDGIRRSRFRTADLRHTVCASSDGRLETRRNTRVISDAYSPRFSK